MAKRLNKRVVFALSVAGFGVMILLAVLMIRQLQQSDPQQHAARAQAHEAKREWVQAARFYRRAWEVSEDADYLVHLGRVLVSANDLRGALGAWREAIAHAPALIEARTALLEVLLEVSEWQGTVGNWMDVREAADGILAVDPSIAAAYHARGLALVNLVSQDASYARDGRASLERAVELA
ncbi:MAG: tetratricopeptide repeat protein, partial [Phycisphaerae bacterium]